MDILREGAAKANDDPDSRDKMTETDDLKCQIQLEQQCERNRPNQQSSRFMNQRCLASSAGGARQVRSWVLNRGTHTSMADIGTQPGRHQVASTVSPLVRAPEDKGLSEPVVFNQRFAAGALTGQSPEVTKVTRNEGADGRENKLLSSRDRGSRAR